MGLFDAIQRTTDRLVRAVSPERGNRRAAARVRYEHAERMRERMERISRRRAEEREYGAGGFHSAENTRDAHSWLKSRLSPQSAIESDREEMLERADSAYKNYELGTNHVEGRVVRVVGAGATIDPDIEAGEGVTDAQADAWNDELRRKWEMQAERIGKRGEPLYKVQQVLHRHYERHGEWFLMIGDEADALSPTSLKVEVIHPARVETPPGSEGNPNIRMGVEVDARGRVVAYHVRETHPGDDVDPNERHRRIPARFSNGLKRVIHHYEEYEAGQLRGYPRMQVGLPRLKLSEEYGEAEAERNYANACVTSFVRTDIDMDDAVAGDVVDSDGKRVRDMAPGQIQYLGLADDVSFSNPSGAPASFADFMRYEASAFAVGAGSSYEILTNDFRGMSYSSLRALWNIEEATSGVLHKAHAETLLEVYRHFVTRCVTAGIIEVSQVEYRSQPWVYWSARVIPPRRASIDPAREDRNSMTLAEASIIPASDLVEQKTGMPAEKIYRRVAKDRAIRRELGLEENMPNMGRDPMDESPQSPTQPGDGNQDSSDANSDRQEVGA